MLETKIVDPEQLHVAMARGTTVVTMTARLARTLIYEFEQWKLVQGATLWPTPDVLPWEGWVFRSWEQAVFTGGLESPDLLLSPEQERQIWGEILDSSPQGNALLRSDAAAALVQEAWGLTQDWRIDWWDPLFSDNLDSEALSDWMGRFDVLCRDRGWLSRVLLPDRLIATLQQGAFNLPSPLVLLNFDQLTPLQSLLIAAIEASGGEVQRFDLVPKKGLVACVACADWRDELRAVGLWSQQRLASNPTASIGIVVPELASVRPSLVHTLDEFLAPETLPPGVAGRARPYNISLGQSLSAYPVVGAALNLLSLLEGQQALEQVSLLLRSPYVSDWKEASPRALLDRRLRDDRQAFVGLGRLIYLAGQRDRPWYCPALSRNLEHLRRVIEQRPPKADPADWAGLFSSLLDAMGWGTGRSLSSEEFQTVEAWRKLLSTYASLSSVVGMVDRGRAFGLVRRLASERLFQPQSGRSPVQVLGLYEAMGLQFDHLWVMGLHAEAWPPQVRPHPYLPLSLQRRLDMPHASAERELRVAETQTRRLLQSADDVVVSYPLTGERSEELGPSPLITELESVSRSALVLSPDLSWRELVAAAGRVEWLTVDPAPSVQTEEVRGGSSLFKAQAACPFRAFAEFRLAARPFTRPEPGLDAMARGSLIHRALELLWEGLESHRNLLNQVQSGVLDQTIRTATEGALGEVAEDFPSVMTARFRDIESRRVHEQLRQWLEVEQARAPFRVAERERSFSPKIAGLSIRLTVDRIDELPDGRRILIDYKTGVVQPSQWFGQRPEEPQLPLYSMVVEGEKAAVLFAGTKSVGEKDWDGWRTRA